MASLILIAATYAPPSFADDDIATMARIVASLQHFPSAADKEALGSIASSETSDSAKAVANAIANISHKVSDADKATLTAIVADESEPADLRELARIVIGVHHVPSEDAKAALQSLAGR